MHTPDAHSLEEKYRFNARRELRGTASIIVRRLALSRRRDNRDNVQTVEKKTKQTTSE